MASVFAAKCHAVIWHKKARFAEMIFDVLAEIYLALINNFVPIARVPKAERADKAADWIEKPAKQGKKVPTSANIDIEWSWDFVVKLQGPIVCASNVKWEMVFFTYLGWSPASIQTARASRCNTGTVRRFRSDRAGNRVSRRVLGIAIVLASSLTLVINEQ